MERATSSEVVEGASPLLGPPFEHAVTLGLELHRHQVRKSTTTPYVAHLLAVASLVLENGGDEEAAIAAILHDAVEDQGGNEVLLRIRDGFGDHVAAIVEACSDTAENPKPPWRQRKERYLAHLDSADTDQAVLLVSAADKLHNLRSILTDHRAVGEELWTRFHAGKSDQLWYYGELARIYRARLGGPISREVDLLVQELAAVVTTASDLTWARVASFPDCSLAALGDPAGLGAPGGPQSRAGWTQVDPSSDRGLVCGFAEVDGLPVEVGLAGSRAVAARIEFVDDVADIAKAGSGAWEDLGQFRCDRLVAVDPTSAERDGYRLELPLPPGTFRASVFRSTAEQEALGLRLILV